MSIYLSVCLSVCLIYLHPRPNTLQLISCDEAVKVTLQCDERKGGQLEEWLSAIRLNISLLGQKEVGFKQLFIECMNRVSGLLSSDGCIEWRERGGG